MKSYLLSHSEACTPEHVQRVLNDTRAVETWVTPFPYAAILISRLDVRDLAAVIRERLPGVWLMVTELNGGAVQGWLPADLWEYVNDPSKARSRKLFSGAAPPTTPFPVSSFHDPGGIARRISAQLREAASAAARDPDSLTKGASGLASLGDVTSSRGLRSPHEDPSGLVPPRNAPPRGPARRGSG